MILGIIVSLVSSPVNFFLKKYGSEFNTFVCKVIWSFENENVQRLFHQLCIITKDNNLTDEEITSFIDGIQNSLKHPHKEFFYTDKQIRDNRIRYSTEYAIDSYFNKVRKEKYVRTEDKPEGYFEDVYTPQKYTKEQITLLEQAEYIEYPEDGSNAQKILGPTRELRYVGLHFPYGSNLNNH